MSSEPVPFSATNYEYKVSLGTVTDRDCINWNCRIRVDEWDDVEEMATLWHEVFDHPVIEVEISYLPYRIPSDTDTGI